MIKHNYELRIFIFKIFWRYNKLAQYNQLPFDYSEKFGKIGTTPAQSTCNGRQNAVFRKSDLQLKFPQKPLTFLKDKLL